MSVLVAALEVIFSKSVLDAVLLVAISVLTATFFKCIFVFAEKSDLATNSVLTEASATSVNGILVFTEKSELPTNSVLTEAFSVSTEVLVLISLVLTEVLVPT